MTDDSQLPTFLVIGAMKTGTSSLYHYLRHHPEVFMPDKKEPHYFVSEYADGVQWRNGTWQNGVQWYRSLFAEGATATARGEASTTYSKWPDYPGVPERIVAAVPDVRLVYVVRDPIKRMCSHYQHDVVRHLQRMPIDRAFTEDPSYLNASRYATQIRQYLDCFDASQLLVISSEDLRANREQTVSRVYRFIGVDPEFTPENIDTEMYQTAERRVHTAAFAQLRGRRMVKHLPNGMRRLGRHALTRPPAPDLPAPSQAVVDRLREELREEMAGLRPFLGGNLPGWD